MLRVAVCGLIVCASGAVSYGAFTAITHTGSNAALISSNELQSLTLGGVSYSRSQLTQIQLTSYVAGSASSLLLANTGSALNAELTRTAAERRALLEDDWRVDTGIINPSGNAGSVGAMFDTPVRNTPGPDLIFMEIQTAGPADAFDVTINGVTKTVLGTDYGAVGSYTTDSDLLSTRNSGNTGDITATDLATLLSTRIRIANVSIVQGIFAVGIDFSDFGVPLNATVSSFTYDSNGSTNLVDPVLIVGVPEPASLALLGCGASLLLRRRVSRSRS